MNKNTRNLFITFFYLISILLSSHIAYAGPPSEFCDKLGKEKSAIAYLLDKDGNISKGPINFGVYQYHYEAADLILIPTTYRIVIFPKRIKVGGSGIPGSIDLKQTKKVCRNSNTYTVSYAIKGFPLYLPEQLPWKVKLEAARFPELQDPIYELFTANDLDIRFDSGVIGEVVDGNRSENPQ